MAPKPKKVAAKPKKKPAPSKQQKPAEPFVTEDAHAAFLHFLPLVKSIPEGELDAWNADPEIVRINAARGVDAIRPHIERIQEELPRLDINRVLELPALSSALSFAANKVVTPASKGEILARQQRVRPLRSQALRILEIFAERGAVPPERVRAIRANTGPIDEARDAIDIAAIILHDFKSAVENKHPFGTEELTQLAADGNWLLTQILPSNAPAGKSERNEDAVLRNQFWTEIHKRYDDLYTAGVVIWGRKGVDAHIPPLLSRSVTKSKGSENAPATPGPAADPNPI